MNSGGRVLRYPQGLSPTSSTTADPRDKAEVYKGLGLRLRYHPVENTVRAEANLDPTS